MNIDNVKRGVKMVTDGFSMLSGGPFTWYVDQLVGAYDFMMARCCPFKVGDEVMLTRAPDFEKAPAWACHSHFLKPGARGIVQSASCGPKGFSFFVTFDSETWIDRDGVEHAVTERGHFSFGERDLAFIQSAYPRPHDLARNAAALAREEAEIEQYDRKVER